MRYSGKGRVLEPHKVENDSKALLLTIWTSHIILTPNFLISKRDLVGLAWGLHEVKHTKHSAQCVATSGCLWMGARVVNMPTLGDDIHVHHKTATTYTVISVHRYDIISGILETLKYSGCFFFFCLTPNFLILFSLKLDNSCAYFSLSGFNTPRLGIFKKSFCCISQCLENWLLYRQCWKKWNGIGSRNATTL